MLPVVQCRVETKDRRFEITLDLAKPKLEWSTSWTAPTCTETASSQYARPWSSDGPAVAEDPNSLSQCVQLRFDFDSTAIILPFDCHSTALRPFDDLRHDGAIKSSGCCFDYWWNTCKKKRSDTHLYGGVERHVEILVACTAA